MATNWLNSLNTSDQKLFQITVLAKINNGEETFNLTSKF